MDHVKVTISIGFLVINKICLISEVQALMHWYKAPSYREKVAQYKSASAVFEMAGWVLRNAILLMCLYR